MEKKEEVLDCLLVLFESGEEAEEYCSMLEKKMPKENKILEKENPTGCPPDGFEKTGPEKMLISHKVEEGWRVLVRGSSVMLAWATMLIHEFDQECEKPGQEAPLLEIIKDLSSERLRENPDYWKGRIKIVSNKSLGPFISKEKWERQVVEELVLA